MTISPEPIVEYLASKGSSLGDKGESLLEMDLFEKGIVDSVGVLELIHFLEDKFEVLFEPEDLESDNFRTIGGIVKLVEAHKARNQ